MQKLAMRPPYLAEFIGTFFLVFFGCGAIIMSELLPASLENFVIPLVFGGTVSVMIYATGHISGAHFNPAVTIGFWLIGRFPKNRLAGYLVAQATGALSASLLHLLLWGGGHSFGVTELSTDLLPGAGLEFILSFALMFVITSVATDSRAVGQLAGIAIGTTVALCAFVGGPLTGAAMNPARSLGPALVSGELQDLWVYFAFTLLGAAAGAWTYEKIRCENENQNNNDPSCC